MSDYKENDDLKKLDKWELHEELGKEYARRREMRGGKTVHQLVAEANAPKFPYPGRTGRKGRQR